MINHAGYRGHAKSLLYNPKNDLHDEYFQALEESRLMYEPFGEYVPVYFLKKQLTRKKQRNVDNRYLAMILTQLSQSKMTTVISPATRSN